MQYVDEALRGRLVLPTIPRVVRRAMALLRDPMGSMHELTAELAQDPVLSARVLRLANSSYYAGRRSLASIDDAVAMVGTHALQTLLIASGLTSAFVEVSGVHLRDFWMHAGVTAAAARLLARHSGADPEAAYLAGLLHESGHLILCQAFPDQARRHLAQQQAVHGLALATLESQAFGAHHADVSAFWCDSMQLPDEITQAVAHYLQPTHQAAPGMATLLSLASGLAAEVGQDAGAAETMARVDRQLLSLARIDGAWFDSAFAEHYTSLREVEAIF